MAEQSIPASAATGIEPHPPDREEAERWIGAKLDDMGGGRAGRIDGLFVDALDGSPTWLVIRRGRFRRRTAVPVEFAAAGVGHVWVPFSREMIRSAPEVDPGGGLSSDAELQLSDHYGIPLDAGRPAELAARGEEQLGSAGAS